MAGLEFTPSALKHGITKDEMTDVITDPELQAIRPATPPFQEPVHLCFGRARSGLELGAGYVSTERDCELSMQWSQAITTFRSCKGNVGKRKAENNGNPQDGKRQ